MINREWRLVELYPDFSNRDLFNKLQELKVEQFNVVMEKFVKVKLSDDEAQKLEPMAFVHNPNKHVNL